MKYNKNLPQLQAYFDEHPEEYFAIAQIKNNSIKIEKELDFKRKKRIEKVNKYRRKSNEK